MNDSGRACITGFGLSTIGDETVPKGARYLTVSIPRHAAPELLNEDPHPSLASDAWAFGMVCYEVWALSNLNVTCTQESQVMTQRRPFHDCVSDGEVIRKLLNGILPTRPRGNPGLDIDQIDDAMWNLMMSCWAQKPENRPTCTQILRRPEFVGLKNGYEGKAKDHPVHERWCHAMLQRAEVFVDLKRVEEILKYVSSGNIGCIVQL